MQLILSPRRINTFIISFFMLCTFYGHGANKVLPYPTEKSWKLKSQKKHYSIYTYEDQLGNFWVKGSTLVSADPNALVRLLDDTEQACNWIANCLNVNIVEKTQNTRVVNSKFSAPWPVTNREVLTQSNFVFDDSGQLEQVNLLSNGEHQVSEGFV